MADSTLKIHSWFNENGIIWDCSYDRSIGDMDVRYRRATDTITSKYWHIPSITKIEVSKKSIEAVYILKQTVEIRQTRRNSPEMLNLSSTFLIRKMRMKKTKLCTD